MAKLITSKSIVRILFLFLLSLATLTYGKNNLLPPDSLPPNDLNIRLIEKLTSYKGEWNAAEKIYKITIPHIDIKVLLSGMPVASSQALDSWVIFKKIENKTVLAGNLMLLQDQVNPVMSVALDNHLEVTQLRSPFLWDSPRILFMSIRGEGSEEELGKAVSRIFAKIEATKNGGGDFPLGNIDQVTATFDKNILKRILGFVGSLKDGIYQVSLGQQVKSEDDEITRASLTNTWIAFAGSEQDAIASGTIASSVSDLQAILLTLRKAHFYILGIDESILHGDQKIILVHFLGIDNINDLAMTLHHAFSIIKAQPAIPVKPIPAIEPRTDQAPEAVTPSSIPSIPNHTIIPLDLTSILQRYESSPLILGGCVTRFLALEEQVSQKTLAFARAAAPSLPSFPLPSLSSIESSIRSSMPSMPSIIFPSHTVASILPSAREIVAASPVQLNGLMYFNKTTLTLFPNHSLASILPSAREMLAALPVQLNGFIALNNNALNNKGLLSLFFARSSDRSYKIDKISEVSVSSINNYLPVILLASSGRGMPIRVIEPVRVAVVMPVHSAVQRRTIKPIISIANNTRITHTRVTNIPNIYRLPSHSKNGKNNEIIHIVPVSSEKKLAKNNIKNPPSYVHTQGEVPGDPVPLGYYPFDEEPDMGGLDS